MPFVSVAICCYNSERYLEQTIKSVIKQTFTDWELIIVNDGSTDATEAIVKSFINDGHNIIYHKQENKGFGAARNKCMELSKSDYIAIIDHDDICLPERLDVQVKSAKRHPQAALLFSNSEYFLDNGKILHRQFDSFYIDPCMLDLSSGKATENLLLYGCFVDSETVLFRKDAALQVGGFNEGYKYIVDYDFFLRIGEKYDMICDSQILSQWRVHPQQASQTMKETIYLETMDLLDKWACKEMIPADVQGTIRLQSWLCLVRYSIFLLGLGRFREGRKCVFECFKRKLKVYDIAKYMIKKIYHKIEIEYQKQKIMKRLYS